MMPVARTSRTFAFASAAMLAVSACTSDRAPTIIVSGASGQLGGLVVEELLARGVEHADLILVSRTPEELERYAEMGASARFGDFTEPESLRAAYEGGDKLLIISLNTRGNPNPRVAAERVALQRTAIEAAVAAGVQHIVYTSFVDAENNTSPIAVDHRATEADLRESGVAWTSLRNQWYADRIIGEATQMVATGRVLVHPNDPGTAFVTREDCAAAAAAVLTTTGHENRVYEITGPELVRTRDVAALAAEITGVDIEVVDATPDEIASLPEIPPSGTVLSTAVADLTGRPGTTARQLLEASRDALMAARGR
ncbi:MAG: SDR family NAD(P)-dependent oxidoreductase [Gemmatimonadetes bacterium]|nr:SDR family NAD(P)-dependent oxidoreductase [Gemmatimonadota bacterium]